MNVQLRFGPRLCAGLGAAALFLTVGAQPARAESASANLVVNATVKPTCRVSTTPINFGDIDVTSGLAIDATGTLSVTCTNGTAWEAFADPGTAPSATYTNRGMTKANVNGALKYNLYSDAGRSVVWGDMTSAFSIPGSGTGSVQNTTIYARISANQTTFPAGLYQDTVVVSVDY